MTFGQKKTLKNSFCIEKDFELTFNTQSFIFSNYILNSGIHCTLQIALKNSTVDDENVQQKITLTLRDLARSTYTYDVQPNETITITLCDIWDLFITTYGTSGSAACTIIANFTFIEDFSIVNTPLLNCYNESTCTINVKENIINTTNKVVPSNVFTNIWVNDGKVYDFGIICTQTLTTTLDGSTILEIEYSNGQIRAQGFSFTPFFIIFKNAKAIRLRSDGTTGVATVNADLSIGYVVN